MVYKKDCGYQLFSLRPGLFFKSFIARNHFVLNGPAARTGVLNLQNAPAFLNLFSELPWQARPKPVPLSAPTNIFFAGSKKWPTSHGPTPSTGSTDQSASTTNSATCSKIAAPSSASTRTCGPAV